MRIMGIDPSLTGCGFALLVDGELKVTKVVSTPATDTRGARLMTIASEVDLFIRDFGPVEAVAMEDYAFGSPYNRESMGEVGGVIKLTLHSLGIEPVTWPNYSWKAAVLGKGSGHTKKEDLKLPIFKKYSVEISDMNALEAFCVAMAEHLSQSDASLRPKPKPKKGKKK